VRHIHVLTAAIVVLLVLARLDYLASTQPGAVAAWSAALVAIPLWLLRALGSKEA
jgi:hypothetical protein